MSCVLRAAPGVLKNSLTQHRHFRDGYLLTPPSLPALLRLVENVRPWSAPELEEAFEQISKLAATFQANEARYLSPDYQEAEARKDFIDKFFIALGWDVNHDDQPTPTPRRSRSSAPMGLPTPGRLRLLPRAQLPRRAFLRRGEKALSGRRHRRQLFSDHPLRFEQPTPLAVITDFEQFHVLDCRFKADIKTALNRAVRQYHYRDYIGPREIRRDLLAILPRGRRRRPLEKLAGTAEARGKDIQPGPRISRTSTSHSSTNSRIIARRSRRLSREKSRLDSETLTEVTQRTLDRLVFMRFLEDKLIEPQRMVARFGDKGPAWQDFIAACRRLDGIYNGIVFKEHAILDAPSFRADNEVFADICRRLSHEHSPYDFDAIPIHILGSIYERFLGKVIVATDKRVRVEDKPEVRKAGGVYYTPEYIVRYIVENTVGKLIARQDARTDRQDALRRHRLRQRFLPAEHLRLAAEPPRPLL